jgi:hypothetical protein
MAADRNSQQQPNLLLQIALANLQQRYSRASLASFTPAAPISIKTIKSIQTGAICWLSLHSALTDGRLLREETLVYSGNRLPLPMTGFKFPKLRVIHSPQFCRCATEVLE